MGTPQILSEIELLKECKHSSIIKYIAWFEDQLAYYLVMENFGTSWKLEDGTSPRAFIVDPPNQPRIMLMMGQASCSSLYDYIEFYHQVIPRHTIPQLFRQICEGLEYLHSKNVVHGDIKEENILIGQLEDGSLVAKICDFGHALKVKRNQKQMVRYGTKEVSAPELFDNLKREERGDAPVDRYHGFEQDIWALGFLLYSMIFGNLPDELPMYIYGHRIFSGTYYPIKNEADLEKNCADLLKRMLAVDPRDRITIDRILVHPWLRKRTRTRS